MIDQLKVEKLQLYYLEHAAIYILLQVDLSFRSKLALPNDRDTI